MAASENSNPFLRGSPQRSSHNNLLSSSVPTGVEFARQRARQAADLYHNTVVGCGDTGGVVKSSPSVPSSLTKTTDSTSDRHEYGSRPYYTGARKLDSELVAEPQQPQSHGRDQNQSTSTSKSNNSGSNPHLTSTNIDAYYKQKLRSGFIDLRNSYSEKRKPRNAAGRYGGGGNSLAFGAAVATRAAASNNNARTAEGKVNPGGGAHHREIKPYGSGYRSFAERRGLYRSNSSLELENLEYGGDNTETSPLRRDYGSTSSLDIMSVTDGDSFFQLLQDYRNENWDQRAPAPPQVQDLLKPHSPTERSNSGRNKSGNSFVYNNPRSQYSQQENLTKLPNGSLPAVQATANTAAFTAATTTTQSEEDGPAHSPKLKTKSQKAKDRKGRNKSVVSEGSGGLFKKLRGVGSTKGDSDVEGSSGARGELSDSSGVVGEYAAAKSLEERLRKKAFVHYDCQSLGLNLNEIIKERTRPTGDITRRNTTTGASAASSGAKTTGSGGDASIGSEDTDYGDNKNNELVYSCPFFRNEIGGENEQTISLNRVTAQKRVQQLLGNNNMETEILMKAPVCNGIAVLDNSPGPHGLGLPPMHTHRGLVVEYVDHGALYYRTFFHELDHQNFFGVEESVGPLAISLKREKVNGDEVRSGGVIGGVVGGAKGEQQPAAVYQYRVVVRTSQLHTYRGCILEDVIPSSSRLSSSRGLPPKDVLEYVVPELNLSCLRFANTDDKTTQQLLKLDEQGITRHYKFGVMYCRSGQSSEEEMYNNEHGSPAFEEFLDCVGERVKLQGFEKYRGGLDCKSNSTGTQSLFAEFLDYEIMFHVSTMLPFTPNNKQQLLRKRHIGNDIVTIIFQEPGALPFTPKSVRSHFQHVFIIVRAHLNPDTHSVKYSIAVSRSKEVPAFGPPIPDGTVFNKGPEFAEFLLTKSMNAENAVHKSHKFTMMATRTREQYIRDLATNHCTTATLESGSKLSKFSLSSGKKKEKGKVKNIPDCHAKGAVVWNVQVEDFGENQQLDCYLAISMDTLVILEEETKEVIFYCPTKAIIGWTSQSLSLRLYFDRGECVALNTVYRDSDDIQEMVNRLYVVSHGCETVEMALRRNSAGQLGFHVHYEGIVSDVEQYGYAWQAGLRAGCRLVEVCKVAMATLTHDQMIDLLRTSNQVKVVMIPAYPDATPRRGVDELRSSHSTFLAQYTQPQNEVHDHSSDSGSSRSTIRRADITANRSVTDPRYLSPPSGSSGNYSDLRNLPNYMDVKPAPLTANLSSADHSKQSTSAVSHNHTSSHDSTGTRSSGHGSEGASLGENLQTRTDNLSSEGFVSGGDSLERDRNNPQAERQNTYSGWNSQVKIYPAYNKDSYTTVTGPLSPVGSDVGSYWSSSGHGNQPTVAGQQQVPTSSSMDYLGTSYPSNRPPPRTTGKTMSFSNLAPRPYVNPNLSIGKDDRGHGLEPHSGPYVTMSEVSASRRPKEDSDGKHDLYSKTSRYDLSPHSTDSKSNSHISPDDSRQRPPVHRKSSTPTGPSTAKLAESSNFEEDLKRLINPDISFTEGESFERGDPNSAFTTHYARSPRPGRPVGGRLLRTLSDESMCGTLPRHGTSHSSRSHIGEGDHNYHHFRQHAHNTSTNTALSHQQQPQPHSLHTHSQDSRTPGETHLQAGGNSGKQLNKSSPNIPLPDPHSGLDWGTLVDTANKAFQPGSSKPSGSNQDLSRSLRESAQSPANQSTSNKNTGSWGRDSSKSERVHHLESRVSQLEGELEKERHEKSDMEAEVVRLRRDNVQLQEESQTAAAQLRKFTEWFFQTIDRQ